MLQIPASDFIQRKCGDCEQEEEEKVQRKPLAPFIQRKETANKTIAGDTVTNRINSSKGSGNGMDSGTKNFMESRFGTDFSDVRIHANTEAAQLNRELSAKAFTVGNDIYFNEGEYLPQSSEGKHLLAHELTHTLQQNFLQSYLQKTLLIQRTLTPFTISSIADEIRDATEGLGTDEERIFMNLQHLNRNPVDIQALTAAYQNKYHESLEALLRDEMSGSELRLALEQINIIDDPDEGRLIAATAPANAAEYKLAAQRLYHAINGLGTDEETIYAVLIPLSNDPAKITEMESSYLALKGSSLIADIKGDMSGTELDYALYLLNTTADTDENTSDPKATLLEGVIWANPVYQGLKPESKDRVKRIISKARTRPPGQSHGQRYYYLTKLNIALSSPFNGVDSGDVKYDCSPGADEKNRKAVDNALKEEQEWNGLFSDVEENIVAAATNKVPRTGQQHKKFYVDASDPTNIRVQIKVKLKGKDDEVAKIKQLEDAIERAVSMSTKGYYLDIVFVESGGPDDVFEFTVNFCLWANSGNWASGPVTLSHEVHHALGLPDRYDYIESHSKNPDMNVAMRLVWFEAEMDKTVPNNPHSKMAGSGNPLLNDDVCMVAFDPGPQRNKCIEERTKFNSAGSPP